MEVLNYRTPGMVTERLARVVQAELTLGEQLLWAGRPSLVWFTMRGLWPGLVGAVMAAMGVMWVRQVAATAKEFGNFAADVPGPATVFPLIGCAIIAVGGLLLLSPVWFYWQARRTVYAVTAQRAMVVRRGVLGAASCESYGPEKLGQMFRRQWSARRGDLVFEEMVLPIGARGAPDGVRRIRRGFLSLDGVAEVEDLIRRELLSPVLHERGRS